MFGRKSKVGKVEHFQTKALSIFYRKRIWDLFFAAQFLWPQHFLRGISDDIFRPIYVFNNKTGKKIN